MNNDITPQQRPTESHDDTSSLDQPANTEMPVTIVAPSTTRPDPPKRRKKRWMVVALLITALGVIAATLLFIWYQTSLSAVDSRNDEKQVVTIRQGEGLADIADTLEKSKVIKSAYAFGWYVRINNLSSSLQSGTYRLGKNEDVPKIVKHLISGKTDSFSITFLPGNTLRKHRQAIIDAGYSAKDVDAALEKRYDSPLFDGKPAGQDLEGYIYGETYQFSTSATPEQILERTFEQYEEVISRNNLVSQYKKRGFSLYEAITLASIIQREVTSEKDMAQVSQIFQLRLERDMQLGSDVTYQYIADKTGVPRDVNLDSPYNTRRYTGLTPGPIASPGVNALLSVAKPANGDYIFFLSGDDDKTYYGRTVEEHEANIRNHCQKKCQII